MDKVGEVPSFLKLKKSTADEKIIEYKEGCLDHQTGVRHILEILEQEWKSWDLPSVISHRVIHGGNKFQEAVFLDQDVIQFIQEMIPLARIHHPASLACIEEITKIFPEIPQTVVFDTSFHQTMPEKAWRYALPRKVSEEHRIRRYGFHGISHQSVMRQTADFMNKPVSELNLITIHLGNGASIAAINQQNIKRLMAYSSIGHIGYALIGLAAANLTGIRGVLTYLAIYLVMNIGAFACILCIRKGGKMLENINDFSGLAKTHPFLATATATFMFSLAGIPPLAGFFGKFYIFLGAIEAELYMLAIIGVLTSVIGAFYYLRIIKIMYFSEPIEQLDLPFDTELRGIILITGLLVALFFIYPTPLISAAETAANALLTF